MVGDKSSWVDVSIYTNGGSEEIGGCNGGRSKEVEGCTNGGSKEVRGRADGRSEEVWTLHFGSTHFLLDGELDFCFRKNDLYWLRKMTWSRHSFLFYF